MKRFGIAAVLGMVALLAGCERAYVAQGRILSVWHNDFYTGVVIRHDATNTLTEMHFRSTAMVWPGLHAKFSYHTECAEGCWYQLDSVQELP